MWIFRPRPQPTAPPALKCEIDFELSDERKSVVQLLRRVIPVIDDGSVPGRLIDLSRVNYLGPFAAAILLANYLEAERSGLPHRVDFPRHDFKLRAFLRFSGIDHFFNGDPLPDTNHPHNETIPLNVVTEVTWGIADPVIDLVKRHIVISEDDELYMSNSIAEVIQNVEDHSESPIGAVYCARYLTKPQKVRVAIVDRGLGIGTTLRNKHPEIKTADAALVRVVRGGISARSRPNNMGVGISNLWNQITNQLKGEIFIVTEDAVAYSDRNRELHTMALGTRFAGTGVFFTVPVVGKE
jgi:hypothetical protein